MRFAGNAIWFVFGGGITALMWLLGAVIFALTIVGLPLAKATKELAKMSAFPFGKDVVYVRELDGKEISGITAVTGVIGFVINIIWACTFGLALLVSYVVAGIFFCITIIGIPFGIQSFKLAGISIWPVGRRVVTKEMAQLVRERTATKRLENVHKD